MNVKNLTLIMALATAGTLTFSNLNAAEPALSPKVKSNQLKTVAAATSDPNLFARNPEIAASPKVLANLRQLARSHQAQPAKSMVACACCKP